jgi:hypothetical protein
MYIQSWASRSRAVVFCLLLAPVLGTSCPTDLKLSALNVTIEGDGEVVPCCAGVYATGATVQLTATPGLGWVFKSWRGNSGVGQSTSPTLDLVMDTDKQIIATFVLRPINENDLKSIIPTEGANGSTEAVER